MKRSTPPSRLAALLITLASAFAAQAQSTPATPLGPMQNPLWLRYSAISPSGQEIAFAFQGNLFVVPAAGGTARLLVGNGHHSFAPVWSPDGRSIAYASDVYGNFDVFLVDAQGGPSRRLTAHSTGESSAKGRSRCACSCSRKDACCARTPRRSAQKNSRSALSKPALSCRWASIAASLLPESCHW